MKFLHVINVRWYNATAWYAVNLSRILREKGHSVIVAGLPGSPPILKAKEYQLDTFEANFNSNNPITIVKTISKVNDFLKSFAPECIVVHRGEFFWYFALRKMVLNREILIRVRGDIRKPKKDAINSFLHGRCDYVITSGNFMRKYFLEEMKLPEKKVKTIYGGVDTRKFTFSDEGRRRVREEFGFKEDDFVVGIVGRFDHVKGHEYLIQAVSKIYYLKGKKNIRLFLIGFDTTIKSDEIKRLLKKNGIERISQISGYREDIVDCISALDLGVIASVGSEAICRVAFELMAVGIPVVASDVGVLPEIIDNKNLFRAGDVDDMVEKILKFNRKVKLFSDDMFYKEFMSLFQV